MSRFKGWSESAIAPLYGKGMVIGEKDDFEKKCISVEKSKAKKTKKEECDYLGMLDAAMKALGITGVECEYKFLHDRRFRFDRAIPSAMIAIEFEGGIYSNGRHTRGKGYANDAKKYNLAVMHGWRLLRYTTETTKRLNWEYECADEIKRMIGSTKQN